MRDDIEDLLASPAIERTVMLLHDTLNSPVRAGITDLDYGTHSKVAYARLDFVGGCMARSGPFEGQLWGGFGIVVVDSELGQRPGLFSDYLHDSYQMIRELGGDPGAPPVEKGGRGRLRRLLRSP